MAGVHHLLLPVFDDQHLAWRADLQDLEPAAVSVECQGNCHRLYLFDRQAVHRCVRVGDSDIDGVFTDLAAVAASRFPAAVCGRRMSDVAIHRKASCSRSATESRAVAFQ